MEMGLRPFGIGTHAFVVILINDDVHCLVEAFRLINARVETVFLIVLLVWTMTHEMLGIHCGTDVIRATTHRPPTVLSEENRKQIRLGGHQHN
jgi:hypothetical protein